MRNHSLTRLVLIVLLVVMLGIMATGTAGAETEGTTPDGFHYTISGGEATITGYKGTATVLNIPGKIGDTPIKSIGSSTFYGKTKLQCVIIPYGITSIEDRAFADCSSLSTVSIPDSVIGIGWRAFDNCASLSSANIPESVTGVGWRTFAFCSSLSSVNIPNSVTSIEGQSFWGCSSLSSVTIPKSVTSIDDDAFFYSPVTIHGYTGSYAETFANRNYIPFVSLDGNPAKKPGDANGDDTIDIMDLVAIIDYIVSGVDSASMSNADANGDDKVDIMDLVWIIDVIVGR